MTDLTRHDLYERCVQSPRHLVPFLRAVHAGDPRVLGEDFAGTAALSILWADSSDDRRAVAIDLDAEALGHHPEHPRVLRRCMDVMDADDPADVIFVGNFSIGYRRTRADLVAYLKHARGRLTANAPEPGASATGRSLDAPQDFTRPVAHAPGSVGSAAPHDPGVFICDTYGGDSAFLTGEVHRDHWIPEGPHAGKRIRYTWEQRRADPLTGMVTDVLHFRVEKGGVIEQEIFDAFVYEWRLWSVPELRDAMLDAGFATTEVYAKTADAMDEEGNAYVLPVEDAEELDDSFIVLVAGRA
jgi:hypothetical protein